MNARQKGTRNELRSIALLERAGYYCIRSHLSAGIFDVIGIGASDIVLLQVKTTNWPYSHEMEALQAFVAPPNTKKLIHRYRPRIDLPDVKEVA